jgi:hypothetical protein
VACPSSKRKADTTSASAPSDASQKASTPDAAVLGDYECHWQQEGNEFTARCEISSQAKERRFSMSTQLGDLQGEARLADYGFRFVGALKRSDGSEQPMEVDFLHQGPGAFAAVLQLSNGSLVKLSLQKSNG